MAWSFWSPSWRRVGFASGLLGAFTFLNGMGGFLTLVVLADTAPRSEASVFGIPVTLPPWVDRMVIGVFAVVLDVLALLSWVAVVAGGVHLLRGKEPPAPPP